MPAAVHHYRNVALHTIAAVDAPDIVTSDWIDEQLADTYQRCGIRPGLLEHVAGIQQRRWWPTTTSFADAAVQAGAAAIEQSGIDPAQIGMCISTAVCRSHLEPSTACEVHHRLNLDDSCINFDVSNACLGFLNGIDIAAAAIDAGHCTHALIVDAEGSRQLQETTIARLQQDDTTAADVYAEFASLTLGSGAVAAIISTADIGQHRIHSSTSMAGTRHHNLCVGNLDRMSTDTAALLEGGLELAKATWDSHLTTRNFDADIYIAHQVSSVHTKLLQERLGINAERMPITFDTYGNIGPAAIGITLAGIADTLTAGTTVTCLGIGSGLNCTFTEITW